MSPRTGKAPKLFSAAAALALGLSLWLLAGLGGGGATPLAGASPSSPPGPFHALDRMALETPKGPGVCTACHPPAAHTRNPVERAFLNLHTVALDCSVCHLSGGGLEPRRFGPDGAASPDRAGRVFAAQREGAGWKAAVRPGAGVSLVPRGPGCRDCHRRGSEFLSTPGLYDEYRRRLLEDLAVFALREGGL